MTHPPATFNLGFNGWIPVSSVESRSSGIVSIKEALVSAHEMSGWPSGEALFPSAAVRLLAAFVYAIHDADRCADEDDFDDLADSLWDAGRFNPIRIENYMDKWSDSLWLSPPLGSGHHPFLQDLGLSELAMDDIERSRLVCHAATSYMWGNQGSHEAGLAPDAAARNLLVFHLFGPGGGGAKHPARRASGLEGSWQEGRLRGKFSLHPVGETLFDTLMMHLLYPDEDVFSGIGRPSWEMPPAPPESDMSASRTLMEQWTCRWDKAVLLGGIENDGRIHTAVAANSRRRPEGVAELDPCVIRVWRKGKQDEEGREVDLRPRQGRSVWRDLDAITMPSANQNARTAILEHADQTSDNRRLSAWVVVAHLPDNAKEVEWWSSCVAPKVLLDDSVYQQCCDFVADAEEVEKALKWAARKFADECGLAGAKNPFTTPLLRDFWTAMERLFPAIASEPHKRADILAAALSAFDTFTDSASERPAASQRGGEAPHLRPMQASAAFWRSKIAFKED